MTVVSDDAGDANRAAFKFSTVSRKRHPGAGGTVEEHKAEALPNMVFGVAHNAYACHCRIVASDGSVVEQLDNVFVLQEGSEFSRDFS